MRPHALLATVLAGQALAFPSPQPLAERDWPSINRFLAKLGSLFPIGLLVQDSCGVIGFGENTLATLFGIPSYEADPCGDVTILFARGTCDPGSVGTLVGPWLFRSLRDKLGDRMLGVQGVEYPASVDDFVTGSRRSGINMAAMVRTTIQNCPSTKLVLGGYSQGAMVVHDAAANLDAATMAKVSAVVLFGDPYSDQPVANFDPSRVKVVCHEGDNICQQGDFILLPHLTYAVDADSAADFIVGLV